jgi:hypothetical protein
MRNLMVPDSDEESDEGPQGARGSTRNVLARQNSLDEPSGIGKLVQERAGRRAADLAKVQSFSFFEDRADASTPSVNDWRSQRSSGAAKIQLEKEAAMEAAMLQKKMVRPQIWPCNLWGSFDSRKESASTQSIQLASKR